MGSKFTFAGMSEANTEPDFVYRSEWEKISHQKSIAIIEILQGLNVWQAKKILEGIPYGLEANAIISLQS